MVKVDKRHTKEYKLKEIQKNLTKKARLKKQYLKALKEEGYTVPERSVTEAPRSSLQDQKAANKRKFDEKRQLEKQRKTHQKDKKEERRRKELEKIEDSKTRQVEKEKRWKKVNQKTRSGQPLMGPKIDDLLSKIKNDKTYSG